MEIQDERPEECQIGEVDIGECFDYQNFIYIRCGHSELELMNATGKELCLRIEDGQLVEIDNILLVVPITNSKLIIE